MHARSAVFDVYGDLIAERGHQSTVAGLVRLLAPVGINAPAVRTAVSRMVTQGWLDPVRLPAGRGYVATERAVQRLRIAAERAFRPTREWDGHWHLLLVTPPETRTERARLSRELSYLGHAPLQENVWVSPYARDEVEDVLSRNGSTAVRVVSQSAAPEHELLGAWDLDALATSYREWHEHAADTVKQHLAAHEDPDEAAFAARFHLVHQWRKFLFTDPGLPLHLLPPDWPGATASNYFAVEEARLGERADRFVERVLNDE